MTTITKERLIKIQQWRETYGPGSNVVLPAEEAEELARIALASIEAEPVAYIRDGFRADGVHFCGGIITAEEHERTKPALSDRYTWKHQPLYTAPTEPVSVPDESAVELLATDLMKRIDKITGERHSVATLSSLRVSIVEACRAAMLQGADGNSPVVSDGWVACSERMPDIGTEIFYFCQDDGLRDCGIVSSSNFSGKGDAELYVHAEGYDLRLGVDITHWMPLPAAPQQGDSF